MSGGEALFSAAEGLDEVEDYIWVSFSLSLIFETKKKKKKATV